MEINHFLEILANKLAIDPTRKSKIDVSVENLKSKIWGFFQEKLQEVSIFGSYDRQTLIFEDKDADIDILIVFKKNEFQPQTYLNQVREFAKNVYPRSEVYPDFPTITVELDHIKFELVPAYSYAG